MAIWDDVFNSFTGQAPETTYNPLAPGVGYGNAFSIAQGLMPQYSTLNQLKSQADIANQLGVEYTALGPAANQLQKGYYNSILDQLNFGENLSPALQADLTRKIFEARGRSGTGGTQLGRESGIYELALQGEERGRQRRAEASGAIGALPSTSYAYQPTNMPDVGGIYGDLQRQNMIQNNLDNQNEMVRQQNFTNLLNTGGRLLGGAAGGAFGGPFGAMAGSQIGGSLFAGPGGTAQSQAGQQGGIESILQGLVFNKMMGGGGIGGPQYGIGSKS